MTSMSIGEVARQAGVGVETVRFYERQGLLEDPPRRASGYRKYNREAVAVLRFIRRAKELGFTLKEIKGLLELRLDASTTRAEVRRRAETKIADVEARITDLQRIRDVLSELVQKCHGKKASIGCPILEALQGHEGS